MNKDTAIVVLDHSFRIGSRVLSEASHSGLDLFVIYYSPYYHSEKLRSIYKDTRSNTELHRIALTALSEDINRLGGSIHLGTSGDPAKHLTDLVSANPRVACVYWDVPLFAPAWTPDFEALAKAGVELRPVCSDSYNPAVSRRTAKSLVGAWIDSGMQAREAFNPKTRFVSLDCDHEVKQRESNDRLVMHDIRSHLIDEALGRIDHRALQYGKTRDAYSGSCEVSCFMQHGILGVDDIINRLLLEHNINDVYPLVRQLAFRELAIKKARSNGLNMSSELDDWVGCLMTDKSTQNIRDVEFDPLCSIERFHAGDTEDDVLNFVIKQAKIDRWMPNRARMWVAGEAYHILGGGLKALRALTEFFDIYTDDGQSPNNYVNCIAAHSLSYGRVVRLNRDKAIKALGVERLMEESGSD